MSDPYAAHQADEKRISSLIWSDDVPPGIDGEAGVTGIGILATISNLPNRLKIDGTSYSTSWLIRNWPVGISLSSWWIDKWAKFEDRLALMLARVSRRASNIAILEISEILGRRIQISAVGNLASQATAIAQAIHEETVAGLLDLSEAMRHDSVSSSTLRREVARRLGPTASQIRRIREWEIDARAKGTMGNFQIRREIKRRVNAARKVRAAARASDLLVTAVTAIRVEAARVAGVKVSSGNPLDDKTRGTHRQQTRATRANPTPAGQPWTPEAPLRGMMPYGPRCRCWLEYNLDA